MGLALLTWIGSKPPSPTYLAFPRPLGVTLAISLVQLQGAPLGRLHATQVREFIYRGLCRIQPQPSAGYGAGKLVSQCQCGLGLACESAATSAGDQAIQRGSLGRPLSPRTILISGVSIKLTLRVARAESTEM